MTTDQLRTILKDLPKDMVVYVTMSEAFDPDNRFPLASVGVLPVTYTESNREVVLILNGNCL